MYLRICVFVYLCMCGRILFVYLRHQSLPSPPIKHQLNHYWSILCRVGSLHVEEKKLWAIKKCKILFFSFHSPDLLQNSQSMDNLMCWDDLRHRCADGSLIMNHLGGCMIGSRGLCWDIKMHCEPSSIHPNPTISDQGQTSADNRVTENISNNRVTKRNDNLC